ncbi:T9SS type A sorting domain-containing protein [Dyadobacter flavalbus]|uniref:T9SS type A sorting domain-containing protein n=1 Tax=Dyadobacter flavalbus TaxID=2579942 RepID=A0A5M8QQW4_9BACT|nr:Ig-like domain-containing protein [Dyadobacter flavalbus]KAA6438469.1 T9SS type A sorting domain-containing protein [Dyadobacter flavalbus]
MMDKNFTAVPQQEKLLSFKWWVLLIIGFLISSHGQALNLASVTAEPVHKKDVSGTGPDNILAGEQITSFTLINSVTKATIQTLTNGSTLNLAALPTKNINIRANTSPGVVGSVVFTLSGTQSRTQIESQAPYDLFGDDLDWTPAVGSYNLSATPYSAAKGLGTAGTARSISFKVVNPQTVQVNFQDPATVPPAGWVRDYGQAYGLRTGTNQGKNLRYGWKKRLDGSLLDISVGGDTPGNGRNRNWSANVLQGTLMHMQSDDIVGNFNGIKAEGYWEIEVPNGPYDVTVSAGDAGIYPFPEKHSLNVEGVEAINDFIPSGLANSATRFESATVRVMVSDGNLTINADGGINTKINSARIVPAASGPYAYWSVNEQQLAIEKGSSTVSKTFSLELSNSGNTNASYTLSAAYEAGGSGWLSFSTTHGGTEPNVTFNYAAAEKLPVGTYKATVKAVAAGIDSGNFSVQVKVTAPRPYVISSTPVDGATNVSVNTSSIAANNLFVPEVEGYTGGVDNSTITNSTVKLLKVVDGTTTQIQGVVQGTGGGDAISFSPTFALEANTTYKFMVTDGVKSYSKASFVPYTATFTTGAALEPTDPLSVEFTKVAIAGTQHKVYASLVIGPDDKFYALRLDGVIEKFTIDRTSGMLGNPQLITTLVNKYGARSAIGLVFDPASTATNLIAYVSHCSSKLVNAPEFDGKISKLTGTGLATEQLLVTNLPRSTKDHLVNSLAFGPDKALYFNQGSNSSMGAYDGSWQRTESLLSGAILRLDLTKLNGTTLNVKTTSNQSLINSAGTSQLHLSDSTYNPYATNAPLKIYASGIRNAYDLVWHTNGQLYAPANGSAAGGNTPASIAGTRRPDGTFYNGPSIPATSGVQVQNDWLFRIKPNGYYGHPNPLRGEYVSNRGNKDNSKYPTTVGADINYRGAAFDFDLNRSPNGVIEYKSNTFNGALKGKLLVCRFSGGGDIIVLEPGSLVKGSTESLYDIKRSYTGAGTNGLVGMSGFINPLDIVEDVKTGNLYVIEFNWNNIPDRTSQITLLKVSSLSDSEGFATAFPSKISAVEVVGVTSTATSTTNTATTSSFAASPSQTIAMRTAGGDDDNNGNDDKDDDDDHNDEDGIIRDFSTVALHTVTISNTGRGNLVLKGLAITGADAGEFKMFGEPGVNPNKPVKIRKNSSVTFNIAFYPKSKGEKLAKLEAVGKKKKKDQVVSVELSGLGISYEADSSMAGARQASTQKQVTARTTDQTTADAPVLKIYPNPIQNGEKIYIDLSNFAKNEPVTITMHDRYGQLYQAKTVDTDAQGGTSVEMPVIKAMRPGIYIIKAHTASGVEQSKFIME